MRNSNSFYSMAEDLQDFLFDNEEDLSDEERESLNIVIELMETKGQEIEEGENE